MKPIKDFVFGTFYLVSGIYSFGFGMFIEGQIQPGSGNPVVVMTPDHLFPFEVGLFLLFGAAFIVASALQFRRSIRLYQS